MSTQPEAIRLAPEFYAEGFVGDHHFAQNAWCSEATVELRRLHAKNTTPTKPTLQWAFFCAKKKRMFCLSRSFSKFDFSI